MARNSRKGAARVTAGAESGGRAGRPAPMRGRKRGNWFEERTAGSVIITVRQSSPAGRPSPNHHHTVPPAARAALPVSKHLMYHERLPMERLTRNRRTQPDWLMVRHRTARLRSVADAPEASIVTASSPGRLPWHERTVHLLLHHLRRRARAGNIRAARKQSTQAPIPAARRDCSIKARKARASPQPRHRLHHSRWVGFSLAPSKE